MNIIFKETESKKQIHITHCSFKPSKGDYISLYGVNYVTDSVCICFGKAINKIEAHLTKL